MSTLNTCTSSTRPGSPSAGDTLFQEDTNQIIVWSGSAWKLYDSDGAAYQDSDITALSPHIWLDGQGSYFYDDHNKSNLVTFDNSSVGAWADRSGNGFDFVQSTVNSRPIIVNNFGVNNKTFLHYDGDQLSFTGTTSSEIPANPSTLFLVALIYPIQAKNLIKSTDSSLRIRTLVPSGIDTFRLALDDFGGVGDGSTFALTDDNIGLRKNIFIYALRGGSSLIESFVNGAVSADTETNIPTGNIFNNGATYDILDDNITTSPNFLGEFMVFDSALSDANMNTVFGYLSNKYGIAVATI
jgi:hypothetical protein